MVDEQPKRMAKVCLDLHEALGVKWGDNPYRTIDRLKKSKADAKRLDREVNVAAGMLSTTGEWAKKHPEEALAFIRKTAAEIVAKDGDTEVVLPDSLKMIVDFGDGKKLEVHPNKLVIPAGQCLRVRLNDQGCPEVTTAEYDELECTNGG